jgi:hypothetical protein
MCSAFLFFLARCLIIFHKLIHLLSNRRMLSAELGLLPLRALRDSLAVLLPYRTLRAGKRVLPGWLL